MMTRIRAAQSLFGRQAIVFGVRALAKEAFVGGPYWRRACLCIGSLQRVWTAITSTDYAVTQIQSLNRVSRLSLISMVSDAEPAQAHLSYI